MCDAITNARNRQLSKVSEFDNTTHSRGSSYDNDDGNHDSDDEKMSITRLIKLTEKFDKKKEKDRNLKIDMNSKNKTSPIMVKNLIGTKSHISGGVSQETLRMK